MLERATRRRVPDGGVVRGALPAAANRRLLLMLLEHALLVVVVIRRAAACAGDAALDRPAPPVRCLRPRVLLPRRHRAQPLVRPLDRAPGLGHLAGVAGEDRGVVVADVVELVREVLVAQRQLVAAPAALLQRARGLEQGLTQEVDGGELVGLGRRPVVHGCGIAGAVAVDLGSTTMAVVVVVDWGSVVSCEWVLQRAADEGVEDGVCFGVGHAGGRCVADTAAAQRRAESSGCSEASAVVCRAGIVEEGHGSEFFFFFLSN